MVQSLHINGATRMLRKSPMPNRHGASDLGVTRFFTESRVFTPCMCITVRPLRNSRDSPSKRVCCGIRLCASSRSHTRGLNADSQIEQHGLNRAFTLGRFHARPPKVRISQPRWLVVAVARSFYTHETLVLSTDLTMLIVPRKSRSDARAHAAWRPSSPSSMVENQGK